MMENEENNEEIDLMSIDKKYEYYKNKYLELKKENERLVEDNKKLMENLKNERNLRQKLEEELKYKNISNKTLISLGKIKDSMTIRSSILLGEDDDDFEDEDLFIKNNNNKDELNINNINKINNLEKIINIEPKKNSIEENEINENNDNNKEINELIKIKNDNKIILDNQINNNYQNNNGNIINNNNNQNNNDNIINNNNQNNNENIINNKIGEKEGQKLIDEEYLTKEFIIYGKDSISLRNNIFNADSNINKMYHFIKKMKHHFENLKKGVEVFNKSITLFNEFFAKYGHYHLIEEFPFLSEQISIIQKCFSTVNIYCLSLTTTIDSSCSYQINNIVINDIKKLIKLRSIISNEKNEFLVTQNKFLNKKNKKENKSLKEKYYTEYKNLENKKYIYYTMINKYIMMLKTKLPEIISLLTYSYITFFTNIRNELEQTNNLIRNNLENILNKVRIQSKIEKDMDKNKKEIIDKVFSNIKAIKNKEGFLYAKDHEKSVRRYVKISNGNIIYYKLNKVIQNDNPKNLKYLNIIDNVDTSNSYEICNLLLSNVKKIESNTSPPFCFEINTNTRKSYVFQSETEYDLEEWVESIKSEINQQIISFDGNNTKNQNNNEILTTNDKNNKNDKINNDSNEPKKDILDSNKNNDENKNKIEKYINENICSDCGAQKPTWLSLNWLTIICIDCSAIHRSLGVQISKIRSLELDNIKEDYIELLSIIKQNEINDILEEKIKEYENEKPNCNSTREQKEQFIINKYKNKKYMNKDNKDESLIIKDIFESINNNDLLNIYKLVKRNSIDINKLYKFDNDEYYFIQYCLKFSKISCFQLFCSLDADLNLLDCFKGNK